MKHIIKYYTDSLRKFRFALSKYFNNLLPVSPAPQYSFIHICVELAGSRQAGISAE